MKIILLVGILFLVFVNIFASKVEINYDRLEQPSCLDLSTYQLMFGPTP